MRPVVSFLSLLLLSPDPKAHLGAKASWTGNPAESAMDRGETLQAPRIATSRKLASRMLLEFRFQVIKDRHFHIWEDSLLVPPEELPRFRRVMQTAAKVLAEAEGRLGELKRHESESEYRKWESLRARTERTLFGLDRYLSETEALWFPTKGSDVPAPANPEKEL